MWPSSACQPNRARVSAEVLAVGGEATLSEMFARSDGVAWLPSIVGLEGNEYTRGAARACMLEISKPSGVVGSSGSSEAIASRD